MFESDERGFLLTFFFRGVDVFISICEYIWIFVIMHDLETSFELVNSKSLCHSSRDFVEVKV